MPTPKRRMTGWPRTFLACAALAVLGACVPPDLGAGLRAGRASPQITLNDGLVLSAPRGYCVDPASTRQSPEGAFVLFGNCAAIARDPGQPQPIFPALLSATLGPAGARPAVLDTAEVEGFFRSDAGRAVLARSGRAEDVELLEVEHAGDLLLLKLRDASGGGEGLQAGASYWRAITGLGDRLAALSVLPLEGARIADRDQIDLLQGFAAQTRAARAAQTGG